MNLTSGQLYDHLSNISVEDFVEDLSEEEIKVELKKLNQYYIKFNDELSKDDFDSVINYCIKYKRNQ